MHLLHNKRFSLLFQIGICLLFPAALLAQGYDCEEELFSKKDKKTRLFGYINALGEYRVPPVFLKAKPFVGKTAIVQQGNRFGVINCEGILVVPAEFEEIASFSNGKGWAKKGGLYGLVNEQGRMLIQPMYEEIKELNLYSGVATWVKKAGFWGLISKETGRMLLAPKYEDVSIISDSAAIGRLNSLQDLIYTGDGRVIISGMRSLKKVGPGFFIYESKERTFGAFNSLAYITLRPQFSSIVLNWNYLQTKLEGKSGLRTLKGAELLPERFDSISPFIKGFAVTKVADSVQIINSRGEYCLPTARYSSAQVLNADFALVELDGKTGFWIPSRKKWNVQPVHPVVRLADSRDWLSIPLGGGKFALQDAKNNPLAPRVWDSLNLQDPADRIRAWKGGKLTLISSSNPVEGQFFDQIVPLGESYSACYSGPNCQLLKGLSTRVIQEEFSSIRLFHTSAGICFAGKKGGFESLYSEKGKLLHQGNFESVLPATGKLIVASANKKWGVAGSDGNWISDNRFDSVQLVFRNQDEARFPLVFYKKGKSLLMDEKGKELTEPCNCVWFEAGEGKLFRRKGDAIQMFDAQGKRAGDIEFEDFKSFSEGNVAVKTAGKWGFANHAGRMVIPAKFSEVLPFIGGIAYAKENGLWGVLRKNGSWLVKPSGISVSIDSDGKRKLVLP